MALIRINPTKMLIGGDKKRALEFLGAARSQMEILKKQMSFQKLSQGTRKIWLFEDVHVECFKCHNYQESRIWVRPHEDNLEIVDEAIFFIRIFHPGWFPVEYDSSDGSCHLTLVYNSHQSSAQRAALVPSLRMDRLILWKSAVADGSPGEGSIFFDVDLISETVYASDDSFDHDDDVIKLAKSYLSHSHEDHVVVPSDRSYPGWDVWPELKKVCSNMTPDWFTQGDVSDPLTSYQRCTYSADDRAETEIPIDGYYTGPAHSGKFYHMIDNFLLNAAGDFYRPSGWSNTFCPSFGGSPSINYDQNTWHSLAENASYYPKTGIPEQHSEYQNCFPMGYNYYYNADTYMRARNCTNPGIKYYPTIVDNGGQYYTAKGDKNFPSFFIYTIMPSASMSNRGSCCWELPNGSLLCNSDEKFSYSISNRLGLTKDAAIVTPLEVISFDEICSFSGSLFHSNHCDPHGASCFRRHEFFTMTIEGYRICRDQNVIDMLPCTNLCENDDDGGGIGFGKMVKKSFIIDSRVDQKVTITDPEVINTNLMALSIYVDRSAGQQAAYSDVYWGTDWRCNDVIYGGINSSFDSIVPITCSNELGVVYYIFSPQDFWWEDSVTGEQVFWDIHTQREASALEINSYRVLDLEDYVNAILFDLRTALIDFSTNTISIDGLSETLDGLPLYDSNNGTENGFYTLKTYGYSIYDGFLFL